MSRFLKLAAVPVLALGIAFLSSDTKADAGGFSISIGNYGYGYGYRGYTSLRPSCVTDSYYNRSYRPSYNYYRSYRPPYGYHHPRSPRYDFRPPSFVPYRNHLDYYHPRHFRH